MSDSDDSLRMCLALVRADHAGADELLQVFAPLPWGRLLAGMQELLEEVLRRHAEAVGESRGQVLDWLAEVIERQAA